MLFFFPLRSSLSENTRTDLSGSLQALTWGLSTCFVPLFSLSFTSLSNLLFWNHVKQNKKKKKIQILDLRHWGPLKLIKKLTVWLAKPVNESRLYLNLPFPPEEFQNLKKKKKWEKEKRLQFSKISSSNYFGFAKLFLIK